MINFEGYKCNSTKNEKKIEVKARQTGMDLKSFFDWDKLYVLH